MTKPVELDPKHHKMERNRATLTFYAIGGLLGFGIGLLAPATKALREDLDLSYSVAAFHSTAYAIGFVITGLAGDRLVRRLGRSTTLSLSMAMVTAGLVLLCLGQTLILTLSGAFLVGAFGVFLQMIATAVLSERNAEHRTTAIAELNAVVVIVGAVAPVIVGAFVLSPLGWRGALIAAVTLYVAVALLKAAPSFGRTLVSTHHELRSPTAEAGTSSSLPRAYWWAWLLEAVAVSSEFAALIWAATYFQEELGTSSAAATVCSGTFFFAEGIARMLGGPFARRVGSAAAMNLSIATALIGFVVFWSADSALVAVVGYFVVGLGIANLGIFPTTLALSTVKAGHIHDMATTRIAAAIGLAILSGPFALGWLADRVGIRDAYLVLPGLLLATVIISWTAHRATAKELQKA